MTRNGTARAPVHSFLSFGFRPFFLGAAAYAALAMARWSLVLGGLDDGPELWAPTVWHGHEMLFGFIAAVIAGFLLTAVPSWTGAPPLQGWRLGLLVMLWLAGRAAFWTGPPATAVAAFDLAFLPALGFAVARTLIAARKPHNLVFLALLALLTAGNALVHAEALGLTVDTAALGLRVAIVTVVLMIAMIGGRVVPAFTANALTARGGPPVARSAARDRAAILATVVFALAEVAAPGTPWAGAAALAAALAHLARMVGWRTRHTLDAPILWVLHLGYAWLVIGLGLKAMADLAGLVPDATATHGLTTGAFGTMTLAIMSRATLGHTGRPLVAPPATVAAYILVSLAAVARTAVAPWWPVGNLIAGALWALAFGLFVTCHGAMLIGPRRAAT